jgi:hypothetical protein
VREKPILTDRTREKRILIDKTFKLVTPAGSAEPPLDTELMIAGGTILAEALRLKTAIDPDALRFHAKDALTWLGPDDTRRGRYECYIRQADAMEGFIKAVEAAREGLQCP